MYYYKNFSTEVPGYTRVMTRTSAPVITLPELKAHLYLFDETEYDDFLNRILLAGQELAENYIGEYLSDTTIIAYYPRFNDRLMLPNQFVSSISSITFTDVSGNPQTVDANRYLLDSSSELASVNLRRSQFSNWHSNELSDDIDNPISVTFVTSVPTALYDELVRHAVLLYCADMFRDRENYTLSGVTNHLPLASERLLAPLKRRQV